MGIAKDNFAAVWPVPIESLIEFLARLRAAFGGDLDAALILAVIGSAEVPRHKVLPTTTYEKHRSDAGRYDYVSPVNTLSIAEITGVPRETVRRKLLLMEKRGWISRDEKGFWRVEPKGTEELAPTLKHTLDCLTRLFTSLD